MNILDMLNSSEVQSSRIFLTINIVVDPLFRDLASNTRNRKNFKINILKYFA